SQTQKYDLSEYEHCIDLSEEPTEVLLESEDMEIMHEIMLLLDEEGFDFGFVTPYEQPNLLGSVFGENTPLARSFPKIVVRSEDIQAATDLLNNSELGLFDIPEELRDPDELKDLDESEEEPEDVDL
ncbi:MAG: hypothetical protein PHF29_04925, partial [Candidatus Riflebacteria bacterium]|nr:hypothetical protein [Candidatus Riflebacteria bacterium]